MSVRRNIKNVVYNYSEAARKAREATSNDPWGPSTTLMQEVADLTYDMIAYSDIMPIIWKRLNDHGKNWRHVYKSLVLLDYLVRYGCKRITQQCKENIFVIQTLKDFQYIEGNKDQGLNVREKAKQLVSLLKDDERLKNERAKAEALRQRMSVRNPTGDGFNQRHYTDNTGTHRYGRGSRQPSYRTTGYYSTSFPAYDGITYPSDRPLDPKIAKDYAAPTNAEEEAIQMQLALALSKEEAQSDQSRRMSDFNKGMASFGESSNLTKTGKNASENDLIGIFDNSLNISSKSSAQNDTLLVNRPVSANPWISQPNNNPRMDDDVWGTPSAPWTPFSVNSSNNTEWDVKTTAPSYSITPALDNSAKADPSAIVDVAKELNHFLNYEKPSLPDHIENKSGVIDKSETNSMTLTTDVTNVHQGLPSYSSVVGSSSPTSDDSYQTEQQVSVCPETFLREHHNLVNLDNLADKSKPSTNPFVLSSMTSTKPASNPFVQATTKAPTLNELAMKNSGDESRSNDGSKVSDTALPSPLIASSSNTGSPTTASSTSNKTYNSNTNDLNPFS